MFVQGTRRGFLSSVLAIAGASALPARGFAMAGRLSARELSLENLHTGERLKATYWEKGAYLPDALAEVNRILRDFRTGDVHPIAPPLLDLLDRLALSVETRAPFEVISGYRSPKTNAALADLSGGVAKKSLHMRGMAIDVRLGDVALPALRDAAIGLKGGGVGFYPRSGFVHVDIGRVRRWG